MHYPESYQSYWALDPWKQQVVKGTVMVILLWLLYNQCYQITMAVQTTLAYPYTPWSFWQFSRDASNGFFVSLALFGLKRLFMSYLYRKQRSLTRIRPEPFIHVTEEPIDVLGTSPHFETNQQRRPPWKSHAPLYTLSASRRVFLLPQKAWSFLIHTVRVQIAFAVKLTVTVISINGHRVVELSDRYASIVAFLACRAREHAAQRKEMRTHFYEGFAKSTPYKDKQLMREKVNEAAKLLDADARWIELFQHQVHRPKYAAFQLSDECEIEEPTRLNVSYERVQMARDYPDEMALYSLEHLRSDYMEHIKRKDGLFLIEGLESDPRLWQWAVPDFQHYREKWVVVLLYSAYRECKAGMQTSDEHQKEDHFQKAVTCCKAVLDATSRVLPDSRHGKDALNLFLRLCLFLGTGRDAKTVYSRFVRRMQRLEPKWTPGEEIEHLYQEAVTPEPTAF